MTFAFVNRRHVIARVSVRTHDFLAFLFFHLDTTCNSCRHCLMTNIL